MAFNSVDDAKKAWHDVDKKEKSGEYTRDQAASLKKSIHDEADRIRGHKTDASGSKKVGELSSNNRSSSHGSRSRSDDPTPNTFTNSTVPDYTQNYGTGNKSRYSPEEIASINYQDRMKIFPEDKGAYNSERSRVQDVIRDRQLNGQDTASQYRYLSQIDAAANGASLTDILAGNFDSYKPGDPIKPLVPTGLYSMEEEFPKVNPGDFMQTVQDFKSQEETKSQQNPALNMIFQLLQEMMATRNSPDKSSIPKKSNTQKMLAKMIEDMTSGEQNASYSVRESQANKQANLDKAINQLVNNSKKKEG